MCKSLEVAIAVSKRPGYFAYYQPTEEVKKVSEGQHRASRLRFSLHKSCKIIMAQVESTQLLKQLTSKIKVLQKEIDQVGSVSPAGNE
jgi:transcription initiation factor IIE alpha subunit